MEWTNVKCHFEEDRG